MTETAVNTYLEEDLLSESEASKVRSLLEEGKQEEALEEIIKRP